MTINNYSPFLKMKISNIKVKINKKRKENEKNWKNK